MEKKYSDGSWIKNIHIRVNKPSLKDNTADADRIRRGLEKELNSQEVRINLSLVKRIPELLRRHDFNINAVVYEYKGTLYVVDIFPGGKSMILGLAADIGTSTVVVRLLDLISGETIDEVSFHNPQIEMGSDILSRIHFAAKDGGLEKLRSSIVDTLNKEIKTLAKKNEIDLSLIAGMSMAGNTTMTHLFLGLDPYEICREPYIPVINRLDILEASILGLSINPNAPVLIFPNVGSYFGGDLVSGILVSGMTKKSEIAFLVDVGTNAEVVVGNKDWLMACAGAAGPALEGGVADIGMMAGLGVIDEIFYDSSSENFKFSTIGNKEPVGICGSGLIDLVAQLFTAGMIDMRGKFVPEKCGDRLIELDGVRQIIVIHERESGVGRPLTLSQPDIDGLMRSKAAMYTILTTIANNVGISLNEIERFYIAGTFGSYIKPRSAITLGMIPDLPIDTYLTLGNTSLDGAGMALLSKGARDEAFEIRDRITYIELNVNQEFMNLFSAAKFIPHTDKGLFPSVKHNGKKS
jgi:uncharacterized 2Fe-2S/4Fe-4S cluster protein (DUF4445 family)